MGRERGRRNRVFDLLTRSPSICSPNRGCFGSSFLAQARVFSLVPCQQGPFFNSLHLTLWPRLKSPDYLRLLAVLKRCVCTTTYVQHQSNLRERIRKAKQILLLARKKKTLWQRDSADSFYFGTIPSTDAVCSTFPNLGSSSFCDSLCHCCSLFLALLSTFSN